MVQCGEQNLLVRVDMDLFRTRQLIKATDLTLGTAGCRPTGIYSQNHTVLFDYGLHECGSRMAGDFLVDTTHLNHTPNARGSVIVRTNRAVIPIECHYFRKGNVSSDPIKPTWIPFSSTKSGEGLLSFSLRLMNDDWLTERTSTVYYLGDLIHIEASVSMTNHMPFKLYIDSCAATLSPDKDSTPRYNIIDSHGCLLDSKAEDSFSTFVLPRGERELDKLQFDLDAFRFFGDDRGNSRGLYKRRAIRPPNDLQAVKTYVDTSSSPGQIRYWRSGMKLPLALWDWIDPDRLEVYGDMLLADSMSESTRKGIITLISK
ncbi:zona pellucida sperm-binding protein 3-like [Heptranchias perlo]|uniref:zona pellucida sperm-binding protein 3-like n=1 Tax=Heptranchias perlo TaxID=212740 RepID=UPI0035599BC4